MDLTCQRVTKSVAVTTATLDAALLTTYYTSPLLPLRAFSVFSAILITTSALVVVLLAPTLFVIHEKCCVCGNCRGSAVDKSACVCIDEAEI